MKEGENRSRSRTPSPFLWLDLVLHIKVSLRVVELDRVTRSYFRLPASRAFAIDYDHRTQQRTSIRLFFGRVESGFGAAVTHDHMKAQGDLDLAFSTFLFKLKDKSDLSCDGECSWYTLIIAHCPRTEASPGISIRQFSVPP